MVRQRMDARRYLGHHYSELPIGGERGYLRYSLSNAMYEKGESMIEVTTPNKARRIPSVSIPPLRGLSFRTKCRGHVGWLPIFLSHRPSINLPPTCGFRYIYRIAPQHTFHLPTLTMIALPEKMAADTGLRMLWNG